MNKRRKRRSKKKEQKESKKKELKKEKNTKWTKKTGGKVQLLLNMCALLLCVNKSGTIAMKINL